MTEAPAKLATCKRCGEPHVAWVKSKAGRFYLADAFLRVTRTGASGDRAGGRKVEYVDVRPWQVHQCGYCGLHHTECQAAGRDKAART